MRPLAVPNLPASRVCTVAVQECAAAAIPYLRFYHNHDGWWNTRAYVTQRVRGALGG